MNIQDKVVKAIIVIQEAGQGLTREQLQAILLGNATEELQAMELDQLESFGIAEGADEEDWNSIIDRAIEEGLLKIKNQKQHTLTYTPEGKKFRKKPHAINLGDGADEDVYVGVGDDELDAVMRNALNEKREEAAAHLTSERSKRQIKLIRAIDRKIALDDLPRARTSTWTRCWTIWRICSSMASVWTLPISLTKYWARRMLRRYVQAWALIRICLLSAKNGVMSTTKRNYASCVTFSRSSIPS